MRNLIPVHRACIRTSEQCPNKLSNIAINEDGNPLFIFTDGQEGDQVTIGEKSGPNWNWWPSWPGAKVSSVLPGEPAIFVLTNGNLVESSAEGAEIVAGLDTTITASGWSPDGEIGVLVTEDKAIFLSRSLDMIGEHIFTPSDLNLSKHVSVGWGKKETQFKGRGSIARDPTMPEKVDSGLIAKDDASTVQVSWRGDGEFVAISSIQGSRRVIRTFTREGTLSSVSEPVDYLSDLVAWRPSGAVIASIQQEPHRVVFFERNGLRRYDFILEREEKVRGLAWSFDSDILAVQFESCVELWTTKNYHWYRKQVLTSFTGQKTTDWIYWHPEKRTLLISWANVVETHSFAVGIAGGPTVSPADDGTVAVIDGNTIKVTPLAKFNFPPPMSKFALPVSDANHVAVGSKAQLVVSTVEGFKLFPENTTIEYPGVPRQAAFYEDQLITLSEINGKSSLRIDGTELEITQGIYLLKPGYYQTYDGSVYDLKGTQLAKFDKVCIDFHVTSGAVFGITEQGTLLVCDPTCRTLARGITSMLLSDKHLLVTSNTLLKFIHLGEDIVFPEDAQNEQCREIERGSVLVTVVPSKMLVVLQAPRGNLETIYPRMLVLDEVRRLLRELDYKSAFASCRIHRIDLQFLYDYNSALFEANVAKFTSELGVDYLDLFLSSLKPENVAETKYCETSGSKQAFVNKDVNHVCELLLPHLQGRNIITAYAFKQPPELETALLKCENEKEIQHLIYLTDAELLYRTALAMYDLNLTLTVAQQAQKDPKEYLAFLRAREKETGFRRRFNIDELLKNRELAASHLVQDPEATNEEIVSYVERYELYTTVLPLVQGPRENLVLESYAWFLLSKGEYQQAGLDFEYLGLTQDALEAYTRCGDWRRALSLDPSRVEDLADSCIALKKYADAAEIFNYHLKRPDQAIEYYCQAFRFDDAILVDSSSSLINDCLQEQFGVIQELLSDCKNQVPSQLRRLRELRTKREAEQGFSIDDLANDLEDNMSIAGTETTNASFMTRYTDKTGGTAQTGMSRKTQKNRRREERKKARGKKGTVYEEEYLIASMGRLMVRVEDTRPDAQGLVDALIRRRMREYAIEIKRAYGAVLSLIREHVGEFYTVKEADLVRYDENGERFMAAAPVPPAIPGELH